MAWTLPGPRQPSLTAYSVPFTAGRLGPGSTLVVEAAISEKNCSSSGCVRQRIVSNRCLGKERTRSATVAGVLVYKQVPE